MKVWMKIKEEYKSGTDEVFIRLNVLLLRHEYEDNYTPVKEFCITWKKDHAMESEEAVNSLRELANTIEQYAAPSS